jgi:alcohol dehydrogenase (NADP+)
VVRREDLWITSKLWSDCHAPEDVGPALERTLADLRLSHLDLYLMHWPVVLRAGVTFPEKAEDLVALDQQPLARTWAAMEDLQRAGRCRHIGVSNFSQTKLQGLLEGARMAPAMNQVERHPFLQQPALLAYCRDHGITLTAYSPLGAGRTDQPSPLLADPLIASLAAERGATPAQVLLAWGLACGTVVIPKALGRDHLAANLAAQDLELDGEAMAQLAALDRRERFVDGSFWFMPGSPYTEANLWDGPPL